MKAIVHTRYGPPEGLSLREIPRPIPKGHEVLVKVHASTINDYDWAILRGKPYIYRLMFGLERPKIAVPGAEIAGTVEAAGTLATRFRTGDRVYGDVSEAGFGGWAEYACVREDALAPMPPGLSFSQAAAMPHAGLLAWQGLVESGGLRRGERVLINGAGGGVGTLGVQIAKAYGCEATGVDGVSKLEAMLALGFDQVVDYASTDFTRNGQRYDLILDAKTTRSPLRYLAALAPGGRYVTVGGDLPRLLQLFLWGPLLRRMTGKRLAVLALKPNRGLDKVGGLAEAGALRSLIDGPYRLEEVPKALARFGKGGHIGKIVIAIA